MESGQTIAVGLRHWMARHPQVANAKSAARVPKARAATKSHAAKKPSAKRRRKHVLVQAVGKLLAPMRRPEDEPDDGPARKKLREYLKAHRRVYPAELRLSLLVSAGCAAAMLACVLFVLLFDQGAALLLLEFVGLTTISGPPAASYFVFSQNPPLSLAWVLTMSVLNVVATLCLIVPLAWRGFEHLRDARFVGGAILAAERFAMQHRAFLARWGLVGLVVVSAVPVQGAGVLGAGILGVLMRVPIRRLLVVLASTGVALTVAWTVFVHATARLMADGWWSAFVPYVVVGAVLVAGAVASWRGRKLRYNLRIESIPWLAPEQRERLRGYGITQTAQLFNANLKRLGRKLEIPSNELGRCRNAAELLRLNSLDPQDAERLTAIGIASIRDLAVAPPHLVQEAFEEAGRGPLRTPVPSLVEVGKWREEAKQFQLETNRIATTTHSPET